MNKYEELKNMYKKGIVKSMLKIFGCSFGIGVLGKFFIDSVYEAGQLNIYNFFIDSFKDDFESMEEKDHE